MKMNEDERLIITCDRCKTDISDSCMYIIDCEKAVYVPRYSSKLRATFYLCQGCYEKLIELIYSSERRTTMTAGSENMIDHPSHYRGTKYECIEVMADILTPEQLKGFCIGNAFKYLWRAGKKGDMLEDIKKASWYLGYLAEAMADAKIGGINDND